MQGIQHFRSDPPSVHADNGGAYGHGGPICLHPFRVVAHGDGDAITGFNALSNKPVSHGSNTLVGLGVGQTLVFIDQIISVGKGRGAEPDISQVGWCVGVGPNIHTAHVGGNYLEICARSGELRPSGLVIVVHSFLPKNPKLYRVAGILRRELGQNLFGRALEDS